MDRKGILKLVIVLAVFASIVFFIFQVGLSSVSEQITVGQRIVWSSESRQEWSTQNTTFAPYLAEPNLWASLPVQLKGFLSRESRGDQKYGIYRESIVDDSGAQIDLDFSVQKDPTVFYIGSEIDLSGIDFDKYPFFPRLGKSPEVYLVEGTFVKTYNSLQINVKNISLSQRDAVTIQLDETSLGREIILVTSERPRYPNFRKKVFELLKLQITCSDGTVLDSCSSSKPLYCTFEGLQAMPKACGCGENLRLSGDYCIPDVTCDDGTLEPECSKYQPKLCKGGILQDAADFCGCPDGTLRVGSHCEAIKRCSDTTLEGSCSSVKPRFCWNGQLLERASICGCEKNQIRQGELCKERVDVGYIR